MRNYIIRRVLMIVPLLLGISFIMFMVMHFSPGDPASIRYGLNPDVSQSARADFDRLYGLNEPALKQYLNWMGRFLSLDFGRSFIDDKPVMEKIVSRLPATLLLQGVSIFIVFVIAVPLGVISAVKLHSRFDRITTVMVFIGYATPGFWLALLLILFFGIHLRWFPISGMSPWYSVYLGRWARIKDLSWHLVLPAVATSFSSLAALSRYARSSMIEVMHEKYILTARAKGLNPRRIVVVHMLKNALMPIITIMGLTLPALISGSFIFETIFAWPGMGRLGYEAVMNYDYPVVMGVGVIATFLTLTGILISDIMYAIVDPRVSYKKR